MVFFIDVLVAIAVTTDKHLVGLIEFRCCQGVDKVVEKYTSEGLDPSCITNYPHYRALTQRVVLEQMHLF